MNCLLFLVLIFVICGECRNLEFNINRAEILSKNLAAVKTRNHDYDGHNGRSTNIIGGVFPSTAEESSKQQHESRGPKEDPRLFYQSDIYLQEMRTSPHLNDASQIYPGRQVVRAEEPTYEKRVFPLRLESTVFRRHKMSASCIKCPADRTLLGKTGSELVIFKKPRLVTCAGNRPPKSTELGHIGGPKFGSLLQKGSYRFTGKITIKNKIVRHCEMKIHVVTQICSIPKFLTAKCDPVTKICNFSCAAEEYNLIGPSKLYCDSTKQWNGTLPYCAPSKSCKILPPPETGRVSCEGNSNNEFLPEGSKCKILCRKGWKRNTHLSICKHGKWTHSLTCLRKHNNTLRNKNPSSKHFISLKEFNK